MLPANESGADDSLTDGCVKEMFEANETRYTVLLQTSHWNRKVVRFRVPVVQQR